MKKTIEDHFNRSVELEIEQIGKTEMIKMVQSISKHGKYSLYMSKRMKMSWKLYIF